MVLTLYKIFSNDTAPVQTINEVSHVHALYFQYNITLSMQDMTYEHLSNSQFSTNRNNCARPFHHVEMIVSF